MVLNNPRPLSLDLDFDATLHSYLIIIIIIERLKVNEIKENEQKTIAPT